MDLNLEHSVCYASPLLESDTASVPPPIFLLKWTSRKEEVQADWVFCDWLTSGVFIDFELDPPMPLHLQAVDLVILGHVTM